MPASIDTKFGEGFFLSEENLTKIDDIIKKRFNFSGNEPTLLYEVYRFDDALIYYSSIKDVVSEENSKRNRIKKLNIKCQEGNDSLYLCFEQGGATKLDLSADNRDTALLLTADLKEYLNSEVLVKRLSFILRAFDHRMFFPIMLLVSMLPIAISIFVTPEMPNIDISTATIADKINYIVLSQQQKDISVRSPLLALSPIAILFVGMVLNLTLKFVYPTDIFYWGKEMSNYDSQKKIRSNIFWSVIVALFVGIFGSYIYNRT